jgi:hypothetical protein
MRVAVAVEPFRGSRSELLPPFAQAGHSQAEINTYIEQGEVSVVALNELSSTYR